jgi:hypothetical protein
MEVAEVHQLVEGVAAVEPGCGDRDVLCLAIGAAARLRGWLDGRDVALARQLAEVVSFPEQTLAEVSRTSRRDAGRVLERGETTEAVPALEAALCEGMVGAAHVDVFTKALRRLEPELRPVLAARAERLVQVAADVNPAELDKAVDVEVRRIETDGGMARLERQRRATRLCDWVDREGMWCLSGRFDPETGLLLHNRLAATVDALFHEHVPECCPADPLERQGFLRAHALVALTDRSPQRPPRPEVVVVIDTTTIDAATCGPVTDWGYPVTLPDEVLHRILHHARLHPVIVRDGEVLDATGELNLGRSTRLANRAQRRALRALYPTCAIPGCTVRFDDCRIHHVTWWEHAGRTDLINLVPLCSQHHHAVHDLHWNLTLTRDRTLTVTYPDGTSQTTRPPRRGAPRPGPQPTDAPPIPPQRE